LRESNWVIGGPKGAAARLGLHRTTLNTRIRKLGITRPRPEQF
jgi:formate hydrogenlyase transcriptional activator